MWSIISSQHCSWAGGGQQQHQICYTQSNKFAYLQFGGTNFSHALSAFHNLSSKKYLSFSTPLDDNNVPDESQGGGGGGGGGGDGGADDDGDVSDKKDELGGVNSEMLRRNLEKIVGTDDSAFNGLDLATLIRNKYGRSYDVQLIKKEFMGRNLLALNVMWRYMEQAVSIFIDMDESGGRANEWIYR
ncbi:uncharacterized protein LOC126676132 isoform X2 [Mercurialis annua]|uniref:uncharacterized protein LOC126676132 isoform X2 n=1 Tax=Mercurialis annua TaxID=3986 RepID=UPI00215EF39E|nr:uncharacterized protein LOC126676132 isoform X2 [Mercurialis annua]